MHKSKFTGYNNELLNLNLLKTLSYSCNIYIEPKMRLLFILHFPIFGD